MSVHGDRVNKNEDEGESVSGVLSRRWMDISASFPPSCFESKSGPVSVPPEWCCIPAWMVVESRPSYSGTNLRRSLIYL